eukprot:g36351.t1
MGNNTSEEVKKISAAAEEANVSNHELVSWLMKHKLLISKDEHFTPWAEGDSASKKMDLKELGKLVNDEVKVQVTPSNPVSGDSSVLVAPTAGRPRRRSTVPVTWSEEKKEFMETLTTRFPVKHIMDDELDMSDCEYSDAEMIIITKLLAGNTTIQSLDLSLNPLGAKGQDAVVAFFKKHKTFKALALHGLKLDAAHTLALVQALQECKELTELDLSNNQIGDEGCAALAKLITNTKVTVVKAADCGIGPKGAVVLAGSVTNILEEVDLSGNGVGDEGAEAWSKALAKGEKLRELRLAGPAALLDKDNREKITDKGAKSLADAVAENKCLKGLYVDQNFITTPGALDFAAALGKNTTILVLGLENNSVDEKGIDALKAVRKARKELRVFLTVAPPPPSTEDDAPPPPPAEEDVPPPPSRGTRRVSFLGHDGGQEQSEEFVMRDNPLTPAKLEESKLASVSE